MRTLFEGFNAAIGPRERHIISPYPPSVQLHSLTYTGGFIDLCSWPTPWFNAVIAWTRVFFEKDDPSFASVVDGVVLAKLLEIVVIHD
jgi:hypothetical protein